MVPFICNNFFIYLYSNIQGICILRNFEGMNPTLKNAVKSVTTNPISPVGKAEIVFQWFNLLTYLCRSYIYLTISDEIKTYVY